MDTTDFMPNCPGRLEPTEFIERRMIDGEVQPTTVKGFGFVPDPLPPKLNTADWLLDMYEPMVNAERKISELEGAAKQLANPHMLINIFSKREAIASSAIEDTFASAKELAVFEVNPTQTNTRNDVREVANYVRALEHGLQSPLPAVILRLIREMHQYLMDGVNKPGIIGGEFRKTQNAIGRENAGFQQAKFVPPPPRYLDQCLNDLEAYINTQDTKIPRLIRLAWIHYQFETIHPFLDGNGRLGRLLITLLLCRQGQLSRPLIYVSGYFEQNREDYYQHLYNVSTQGTWKAWTSFFLEAVRSQAEDALDRAEKILDLQAELYARVQQKRMSAQLPKVIDMLFNNLAITAPDVATELQTTPQTSNNLINKLDALGIVKQGSSSDSPKVWVCIPLLELIRSS